MGLAVGRGTGPELAREFERVITGIADLHSVRLTLRRSPRTYHSYASLLAETGAGEVPRQTQEDAEHYERFCREQAAAGVPVVFRTAMNAQSLYLVRQRLQAVKLDRLVNERVFLLLVRDQAQGFYTGDNAHGPSGLLTRTCRFDRDLSARIVAYSLERARLEWGDRAIDRVIVVYKFHLLDGVFTTWGREWSEQHGVSIELVQPDTANRNLVGDGLEGRVLVIAGNEWGDIMHVVLLDRLGLGPQENRFTENVYLEPGLHRLVEYQTVHGSADDIAGRRVVNPAATMRAAAAIMERHAGCEGAERAMEQVLQRLVRRGVATPERGGRHSTEAVVDAALAELALDRSGPVSSARARSAPGPPAPAAGAATTGKRTALLVMDFQNDFCTTEGIGAEYRGDLSRMAAPVQNIPRVIEFARRCGIEVVFVRFLGDERYQRPSWRQRDRALNKRPKCCEGSWGAEFHVVSPDPGERVFTKYAHFDAFLCEGFDSYLRQREHEHLVLVGVYSDVCVDSTARTAFQKGYYVTIISDCTTSLHLGDADIISYMGRVYGARILTHREFLGLDD